jgi:phytoene dehydrogenase-like protein
MLQFDDIIIGAGHNGLICATYLSKAGHKVAVFEKDSEIGGAIRTRELTLPGRKHEVLSGGHLRYLPLSPAFRELEMEKYGVRLVKFKKSFASAFPNGKCICLYGENLKKTMEEIGKFSQKDAKSWENLYGFYLKMKPVLNKILFTPNPFSYGSLFWLYRKLKKKGLLDLFSFMLESPRTFLDEWFESEEAKSFLGASALHPAECLETNGMFPGFIWAMPQQEDNASIVVGGASKLCDALRAYIQDHGGIIQTNTEIMRILIKDGKAVGVQTHDGKQVFAKRNVVANVEPKQLFLKLIGEEYLDKEFIRKVKGYHFAATTLMVHALLREPPKWDADDLKDSGTTHFGPYLKDMARAANEAINGQLPEKPFFMTDNNSLYDPTRVIGNEWILWMLVATVPYDVKWESVGEEYADRCIDILEEYARVKDKIIKRIVITPPQIERMNPNLIKGDRDSGSFVGKQLFFRPFATGLKSPYHTPIEKLYMVGAFTWPGPGINGASGYNVGKMLA